MTWRQTFNADGARVAVQTFGQQTQSVDGARVSGEETTTAATQQQLMMMGMGA